MSGGLGSRALSANSVHKAFPDYFRCAEFINVVILIFLIKKRRRYERLAAASQWCTDLIAKSILFLWD